MKHDLKVIELILEREPEKERSWTFDAMFPRIGMIIDKHYSLLNKKRVEETDKKGGFRLFLVGILQICIAGFSQCDVKTDLCKFWSTLTTVVKDEHPTAHMYQRLFYDLFWLNIGFQNTPVST